MDPIPSTEILESTHEFPGPYHIKAIGETTDDFQERVVQVASLELPSEARLEYRSRSTPGGRHVAVTLNFHADNAEQVRNLYARIREIAGLTLLF